MKFIITILENNRLRINVLNNKPTFILPRKILFYLSAILLSACFGSSPSLADVPKYGVYELSLTTPNSHSNSYTDVTLSATFQGPTKSITIDGFWDGGNTWKVRMAPTEVGTWTLVDVTSNDGALNNQAEGTTFVSHSPTGAEIAENEVLRHGFIKINPDYPHTFMHADGTPFFMMGVVMWRTFLDDFFQQGTFQQIADLRANQGFNVYATATLAAARTIGNEGGAPFNGAHTSNNLNPGFFQWTDKRIAYLNKKGIRPMILIGSPDKGLTTDLNWHRRFQRYLIARWAAYDVIWLGVKEYQEIGSQATNVVTAIGETIEQYDPYGHPTSMHPGGGQSSHDLGDQNWLDFNSLQRGGSIDGTPGQAGVKLVASDYGNFPKPVVQTEAFYEEPTACSGPNSFTDTNLLMEGLWAIQLYGGWNAGYQFVATCTEPDWDPYLAQMDNVSAAYHSHLKSFFDSRTEFWKLNPNNTFVKAGTAWAASQPGKEYVLYLRNGGAVTLDLSAAGTSTLNVEWYNPATGNISSAGTVTGGASRSFTAPDTGAWVLHIFGGAPVSQAPEAGFTLKPVSGGPVPLDVTFDASNSSDSDGSIVSYAWDFGDGTTGTGPVISHTYNLEARYTIVLTVTDNEGNTATAQQTVLADGPAILSSLDISPNVVSLKPNAAQDFTITGKDQYGNTMPVSSVVWSSTGGTIDVSGQFIAGNTEGSYAVNAAMNTVTGAANVTIDGTPPELISVTPLSASMIEIEFSEAITADTASQLTNYLITDSNGSIIQGTDTTNTSTKASLGRVQLLTQPHTSGETYHLVVNNITDLAGNKIIADASVNYAYNNDISQLSISDINVASGNTYTLDTLEQGKLVYIDRTFTYTDIPSNLTGMQYIQTANNDKNSSSNDFLTFTINQPVNVYVAYDKRNNTPPMWLSNWTDTGVEISTSDTTLHLYEKDFTAGTVTLGGNESGSYSMYSVIIAATGGNSTNNSTGSIAVIADSESGGGGALSWCELLLALCGLFLTKHLHWRRRIT